MRRFGFQALVHIIIQSLDDDLRFLHTFKMGDSDDIVEVWNVIHLRTPISNITTFLQTADTVKGSDIMVIGLSARSDAIANDKPPIIKMFKIIGMEGDIRHIPLE